VELAEAQNISEKTMGHAFVLAMLLEGVIPEDSASASDKLDG
jgi:hypothetical protein